MNNTRFRGLLTQSIQESDIVLTGIPFDKNASVGKGASLAPETLKNLSSFLPPLSMDGFLLTKKIYDNGNINPLPNESIEDYFQKIQQESLKLFKTNKFNIFIGGDHSVAIPLQKSFLEYCKMNNKKAAIIHIDAHPDICDSYNGSKLSHACPIKRAIDNGYSKENIVLIGIRGYEEQEVIYLKNNPAIQVYNASYINEYGITQMLKKIKDKFQGDYQIYLSYDIDANDPSFAPGTGTPEAFGLSNLTILKILKYFFNNLPISTMDLVEISPFLDINNMTSWLGLKTLYEIFYELNKE